MTFEFYLMYFPIITSSSFFTLSGISFLSVITAYLSVSLHPQFLCSGIAFIAAELRDANATNRNYKILIIDLAGKIRAKNDCKVSTIE